MEFIPVYQPSLIGNEKKYVLDCVESGWISSKGKYVSNFESEFAKFVGVDYAVGTNNGTTALHLALVTAGIKSGDEVIVPAFTYIASVNAIKYCGATPVFVDSLPDTWQMDPHKVNLAITHKTKAILAVHLYGQMCDMGTLVELSRHNDLLLIEDCAEAIGSKYLEKNAGTFGDISAFSFFGNKTITTGEGGMVVTNNSALADRARCLRGQGLAMYREYWHDVIGFNYRMTNVAAAIGLAQLEQVDSFLDKKRKIAMEYIRQLSPIVDYHKEKTGTYHSYWMFSILAGSSGQRDVIREHLKKRQIETRPTFYPIHMMPCYSEYFRSYPVAENIGVRGINLPSWPGMTDEQVNRVCDGVKSFFGE